jgi:phosphopantothenoylcysteine decarboxylase/phosphopantothenate--cysteine ligase
MHVLMTAGPTREYLDDVRFLSNASSGRMGYALAAAAVRRGWNVTLVTGPVAIDSPAGTAVVAVTSALEMRDACLAALPEVDGVIAVAAVADYRPATRWAGKRQRTDHALHVEFVPNPDILAEICRRKTSGQWAVGFAVEAENLADRARAKMKAKGCDAIIANAVSAMETPDTEIQIIDRTGRVAVQFSGSKDAAAAHIIEWIATHLPGRK